LIHSPLGILVIVNFLAPGILLAEKGYVSNTKEPSLSGLWIGYACKPLRGGVEVKYAKLVGASLGHVGLRQGIEQIVGTECGHFAALGIWFDHQDEFT
jgi:hypothetical protein